MPVYTGNGDGGETSLLGGGRVSKASERIEAYGTVDEVNAILGRVKPTGYDDVDEVISSVQNHLHIIQAELAMSESDGEAPSIHSEHVEQLEDWIDKYEEEIGGLDSFVIPGGSEEGATLHHSRSVCRRAERRVVALHGCEDEEVSEAVLAYVNRLSDALFILARVINQRDGVPEPEPSY